MADIRQRTTFGNRFRFGLRVLGLAAVLAGVAGAVVLSTYLPDLSGLPRDAAVDTVRDTAEAAYAGDLGPLARGGLIAAAAGAAVALAWGLIEVVSRLALAAGRNTAAGSLNAAQVALAVALVVVVNLVSFGSYRKWDFSRDKEFTLAPGQVEQLHELRTDAPTTVVVLQLHKTAGTLSDKPDAIDYAAERKVVEKVRDVVDQLREFGPQFNVAVLDVEDEGYERKLRALTKRRPGLAEAVRDAPENSIFFYADGTVRKEPKAVADKLAAGTPRPAVGPDPDDSGASLVYPANVTRMSFTEFYQLDKTASREATEAEREGLAGAIGGPAFAPGVAGKGNLVLIPQGKDAFVKKVLGLEERRPRVALAVIHPLLSSRENFDEYSAAGLRKALEANGYDVVDVILKKWGRGGPPAPAATTYEESELDRVESRYNLFTALAANNELGLSQLKIVLDRIGKATYAELNRQFGRVLSRPVRSEEDRAVLRRLIERNVARVQEELDEVQKQLAEIAPQYRDLMGTSGPPENRRLTDVKAKLKQYVDDCDLLIVPRLTTLDVAKGEIIPPSLFNVSKDQAEAVKEFVAAGKPVLFALGPTNVDRRGGPGDAGGDDVEALLPRLGIELGRQTVLTEKEAQAMAERQSDALVGTTADVPPLVFDSTGTEGKAANPVGSAFRTTARAVDRKLDVKKSGYRPVYVAPGFADHMAFAPEFAFTGRDSWNEEKPVPDDESTPRFDPAKPDDPKKGTHDEERRGPFPVGVAVEVPVPAEWLRTDGFADQQKVAALLPTFDGGLDAALMTVVADQTPRPKVRLVVVGHGGMFAGKKLDPANESLLLHAVNWELKRDDRLPKDAARADEWHYPRVALDDRDLTLWRYGAVLGLPLLCGFLGTVVLMARKVR